MPSRRTFIKSSAAALAAPALVWIIERNQALLAHKWRAAGCVDAGGWVRRPQVGIWQPPEVRAALRADAELVSGHGVALNEFLNAQPGRTTLASDGDLHRRRRVRGDLGAGRGAAGPGVPARCPAAGGERDAERHDRGRGRGRRR